MSAQGNQQLFSKGVRCVEKSSTRMNQKHSKTNCLQKNIKYKRNEESTISTIEQKYKAFKCLKMQIGNIGTCSFCFFLLALS